MNEKMKSITVALVLTMAVFASGCVQESTYTAPRIVGSVVDANNQFAIDLYLRYKDKYEGDNIFYSPYSISTALAMTYEGARGQTAKEMQAVFHFPENITTMRTEVNVIYDELNKKDKEYQLNTANALWAQHDDLFLDEYFNTIDNYYGGKVTNLNFAEDPEGSRQTINTWGEDQTNDKIKDLIPNGGITPLTSLVLTNAIYFKGDWIWKFDKNQTKEEDFKISTFKTVKTQIMRMIGEDTVSFNYAEADDLQILEMPYKGKELTMLVLLPRKNNLAKVESVFSVEKLKEWKDILYHTEVEVYLPKFKLETKYEMKDDLKELGMPTAFRMGVDFSGMTGKKDLFINQVYHKAFVEVNEEGTEAAAATAVGMETTSSEEYRTPEFRADHPFMFLIQQKETGNILFIGRVVNPSG